MKNILYSIVFAVFLSGCAEGPEDPAAAGDVLPEAPAGTVVARVNGEVITQPLLAVYARGRGLDLTDAAQRKQALDQLIEVVLLAQDARASGLVDTPEVQAEVMLASVMQLSARRAADFREEVEIGDEELRRYYQQEVERAGDTEYHLQHILFPDEDAALEAAGRALRAETDFEALMGEFAAAGGQVQARDLGWANRTQLPAEIAEAAQQLADGQVAPVPVRTDFGWHVLRRAGSRPFAPPPFEKVRGGARRQLVERAVAEQVQALRARADIELPAAAAGG